MQNDFYQTQLHERGWCVIENALTAQQVSDCRWETARIAATCGMIAPNYVHNGTWQTRALELMDNDLNPELSHRILGESFFIRPRAVQDFGNFLPALAQPAVLQLLETFLGRDARVTATMLFLHEPRTPRGQWHASGPFNPICASHYPSPYVTSDPHLTLHVIFNDFTEENGGLLAIPGSHRRVSNPAYDANPSDASGAVDRDEMHITAKEGSVIVLDSRTWIAVAANHSDEGRMSIEIQCAPVREKISGLVTEYKAPAISPGLKQNFPEKVKPLFREW